MAYHLLKETKKNLEQLNRSMYLTSLFFEDQASIASVIYINVVSLNIF